MDPGQQTLDSFLVRVVKKKGESISEVSERSEDPGVVDGGVLEHDELGLLMRADKCLLMRADKLRSNIIWTKLDVLVYSCYFIRCNKK